MKLHAILASIVLALPASALADRKISYMAGYGGNAHYARNTIRVSNCGSSHSYGYRGYSTGGYARYSQPSYVRYSGSRYCAPAYRSSTWFSAAPVVSLSYSSAPRYYAPGPRASYDHDRGSLEVSVQSELRRRGYYRGAVDGDIGPASRAAIQRYQAERGLYASGRIDASLLRSLGI